MTLRPSTLSLAALALGMAVLSIQACAPGSMDGEGEGVDTNGAEITGSVAVGTTLIATGNVNLRKGPSSSNSIIDVVQAGDTVTVLTSAPQNGFYNVKYGSESGWSSGTYYKLGKMGGGSTSTATTSTSTTSTSTTTTTSGGMGGMGGAGGASTSASSGTTTTSTLIATANVNLRSGPGSTYSILEVVPSGASVTLLSPTEQNGFYNVQYQGQTGWSSASYYEAGGSTSTSTSTSSTSTSSSSGGATTWSCPGSYGTVKMANGQYYATEFGCYVDTNGNPQGDPGDNCIPTCLSSAQSSGLCAGMTGPQCERHVQWYAADGARFGCLGRLKVTNPANGKAVVVVALDYGPSCTVEKTVSHAAIDLSFPADDYLFGSATGISDKALVHVDEVDASTPLGPVQ